MIDWLRWNANQNFWKASSKRRMLDQDAVMSLLTR